jgi:predicted transcriptional regulator
MVTKDRLKEAIDQMPDNFTMEEVFEKFILLDKIEQGLNDARNGNTMPTDELKKKLGVNA